MANIEHRKSGYLVSGGLVSEGQRAVAMRDLPPLPQPWQLRAPRWHRWGS